MGGYWLIRALLLLGLASIAWTLLHPTRSANHLALRRLTTMLVIAFAMFAVLFPTTLNRIAFHLGVERGVNLLLYVLVLAFFAQMATAYRRDMDTEKRMTLLARTVALDTVRRPDEVIRTADAETGPTGDRGSGEAS